MIKEYREEDYLHLSGIQHFSFCRRQWALIHIEQQWRDNYRTIEGEILHENVHKGFTSEKRNDLLIVRSLRVSSRMLGVSGICDVVEFHKAPNGIILHGYENKWMPFPVEYKRGIPKIENADRLQLCCQAMCLEEMLVVEISEGALYYGEQKRREIVFFSSSLRNSVISSFKEMHEYAKRGYTPKVKTGPFCRACSLSEICLPKLCKNISAKDYLSQKLREG